MDNSTTHTMLRSCLLNLNTIEIFCHQDQDYTAPRPLEASQKQNICHSTPLVTKSLSIERQQSNNVAAVIEATLLSPRHNLGFHEAFSRIALLLSECVRPSKVICRFPVELEATFGVVHGALEKDQYEASGTTSEDLSILSKMECLLDPCNMPIWAALKELRSSRPDVVDIELHAGSVTLTRQEFHTCFRNLSARAGKIEDSKLAELLHPDFCKQSRNESANYGLKTRRDTVPNGSRRFRAEYRGHTPSLSDASNNQSYTDLKPRSIPEGGLTAPDRYSGDKLPGWPNFDIGSAPQSD